MQVHSVLFHFSFFISLCLSFSFLCSGFSSFLCFSFLFPLFSFSYFFSSFFSNIQDVVLGCILCSLSFPEPIFSLLYFSVENSEKEKLWWFHFLYSHFNSKGYYFCVPFHIRRLALAFSHSPIHDFYIFSTERNVSLFYSFLGFLKLCINLLRLSNC